MPTVTTYQLTPHPSPGQRTENFDSLYLRALVNSLVRESWEELEDKGLGPELFFNRDIKTGITQIGYPLVIYHFFGGNFYLTGINKGADAVDFICNKNAAPFEYNNMLFSGFKSCQTDQLVTQCSEKTYYCVLKNWIPIHHRQNAAFNTMNLLEKINQMQQQLHKHIEQEYCKYLEIDATGLQTDICDILQKHAEPFAYKGYRFWMYDVEIKCNLYLPEMLCLGNNKALGFGRIKKT